MLPVPTDDRALDRLRALPGRTASRLVHRGWQWIREAGAVTAQHPGPLRFGRIGPGTRLAFPQGTVFGEQCIHLGAHCVIGEQVTLTAGLLPGNELGPEPRLLVGDGCVIGRASHVVAHQRVVLGDQVYCGPNVYITDGNHSYDDPEQPVGTQPLRISAVEIGSGSWLAANSTVLPGARLGRNVVVAAGAVVRGSVPDHTVVAGAPSRVVRRYVPGTGWEPPLRTRAPEPLPEGITYEQLMALAERAEGQSD